MHPHARRRNVTRPSRAKVPPVDTTATTAPGAPSLGWTKADADLAKTQAQTMKIQMEIALKMGALLLAEEVEKCFGDIYAAFSNHVLTFGQRLAPIVCSTLGITGPEAALQVQKLLDDEHERILEDVRRATAEGLRERRYKPTETQQPETDE